MSEGPLVSGPQPSLPLDPALLPFFSPVTYLSGAARSHYRSVRKAAGGVASPSARVTDCRSALAAEEVRSGKVIGCDGQEVGNRGLEEGGGGGQRVRERMTRPGCATSGIARVTQRGTGPAFKSMLGSGGRRGGCTVEHECQGKKRWPLMLTSLVMPRTTPSVSNLGEDK